MTTDWAGDGEEARQEWAHWLSGTTRNHGDHDALPYDGHNADLAHLCQVCGAPINSTEA